MKVVIFFLAFQGPALFKCGCPSCTLDTVETQKLEMRGGKMSSELKRLKDSKGLYFQAGLSFSFLFSPLISFTDPPYTVHGVEGLKEDGQEGKQITASLYWRLGDGHSEGP